MRKLFAISFLGAFFINGVLSVVIGKHDPALFTRFRAAEWVPVDVFISGYWPERSARFAAREILGLASGVAFDTRVTSAWGRFWQPVEVRYGMYYVHFETRMFSPPFTRYQCSAWVHWPPPNPVHLDGIPSEDFNYCVPF